MTTTDTPALFSPDQRAALEAVGFTIWMVEPGREHMNYREGGWHFCASADGSGQIYLEETNHGIGFHFETEQQIRGFIAEFMPQNTQRP